MASAYASLLLLATTLMIGPWNTLRGRANPVSSYLRRDVGIWAGMLGIVHVIVGLQVHMDGKFWLYFLPPPDAAYRFPLRIDPFGLTNYAGLAAGLILLMLLAISSNASLRALGAVRWKRLQRWNYAVAALVVTHGAIYQFIEKRTVGFVAALVVVVLFTVALQVSGRLQKGGLRREAR
jgi:sulfoxide reductase heme-binding subunit YedZ